MAVPALSRIDALGGVRIPAGAATGLLAVSNASGDVTWSTPAAAGVQGTAVSNAQDLALAPATSARNAVQPTADVVPLSVRGLAAGQTARLTQWQRASDGVELAYVTPAGEVGLSGNGILSQDWKLSCRVASTAALALPPGGTALAVDGVTLANGDRVLVKDQAAAAQNGIYVVGGVGSSVTLTRTTDGVTGLLTSGATLNVEEGPTNGKCDFGLNTPNPTTVGTTALSFGRVYPDPNRGNWKNPWLPAGAFVENTPRQQVQNFAQVLATGNIYCFGGLTVPAGQTAASMTLYITTAGATVTAWWHALVRLSDRQVMAVTANQASAPAGAVARAFVAAWTPTVDTPVYLACGSVATTPPALLANSLFGSPQAPVVSGASSTAASATPPPVGTVLGALNAATFNAWGCVS